MNPFQPFLSGAFPHYQASDAAKLFGSKYYSVSTSAYSPARQGNNSQIKMALLGHWTYTHLQLIDYFYSNFSGLDSLPAF